MTASLPDVTCEWPLSPLVGVSMVRTSQPETSDAPDYDDRRCLALDRPCRVSTERRTGKHAFCRYRAATANGRPVGAQEENCMRVDQPPGDHGHAETGSHRHA